MERFKGITKYIILLILFSILISYCNLQIAMYIRYAIDGILFHNLEDIPKFIQPTVEMDIIRSLMIFSAIIMLIKGIVVLANYIRERITTKFTLKIGANLKETLYTHILKLEYDSYYFYSKVESVKLSKERGCFRKYHDSLCSQPFWYDRFKTNQTNWIDNADWEVLMRWIGKYGIRNSSTTAVPPTGRSASIVNASYSIEPYFSLYDSSTEVCLNPIFLEYIGNKYSDTEQETIIKSVLKSGNCSLLDDKYKELKSIFKTAREIKGKDHIEMMAVINSCIDESISKTINLPNRTSIQEIQDYILQSYSKGLNGITFFRDKCLEERNLEMEEKER